MGGWRVVGMCGPVGVVEWASWALGPSGLSCLEGARKRPWCACLWASPALLSAVPVCVLSSFSGVRLCDPMECIPPGSSVRGILQARILEWVANSFSRGSF